MPQIAFVFKNQQIMHSRSAQIIDNISRASSTIITMLHVEGRLIDAMDFYCRCNFMFPYARGYEPELSVAITQEDILTRAFFEDLHETDYPGLHEGVRRRYAARPDCGPSGNAAGIQSS